MFFDLIKNTEEQPKNILTKIESIANNTKDFQEQTIYRIEIADRYVKILDSLEDDAYKNAINNYKQIIDANVYCNYLFESWLKWRTIYQIENNGISKFSAIPNNLYDSFRLDAAVTTLKHIEKNEKDEMAINEFLLLATHDIIKRYGEYPYGNSVALDFYEIYND
jgi:hypothetical protein